MKKYLLLSTLSLLPVFAQGATFTVTSTADDGSAGTLRQAVASAIASSDRSNTIQFASDLHGFIITLTQGPITITDHLDIAGPGADKLTLAGAPGKGSLFVIQNVTVKIAGLSIINGNGLQGGAILNNGGLLTIDSCSFRNNSANSGGAILNVAPGTLAINHSSFSQNQAVFNGGAIYNYGLLNVDNSTFTANSANGAQGQGGAIFNDTAASRLAANITLSSFVANSATRASAIYSNTGATLNLTQSTISNNTTQSLGAIFCDGSCVVDSSTVNDNFTSSDGAGLYNFTNGNLTVVNSTIEHNFSQGTGGGIRNSNLLTVKNSTISRNYANQSGGIFNDTGGKLTLSNSIVATNMASTLQGTSASDIVFVTFASVASGGFNLIGNADFLGGLLPSDQRGTVAAPLDPKLGPLKNNGGPTETCALEAGSSAINRGNPDFSLTTLKFDQRGSGFTRISDNRLDIGAFEVQGALGGLALVCPADVTISVASDAVNGPATFTPPTLNDENGRPLTVTCTPAPGTLVPLGKTEVTCVAKDTSGVTVDSCKFNVIVNTGGGCNANSGTPDSAMISLFALLFVLSLVRSRVQRGRRASP